MEKKYQLGTKENEAFLQEIREGLFKFGRKFPSPGGSAYYLGDDGTPWKEKDRDTYVTCRMAHVYSLGSLLNFPGSEALTDEAIKALHGELQDTRNGGWYAGLAADGSILPTKPCYAHAFVVLAGCSALTAGRPGAKELLDSAIEVFDKYFWDETEGLMYDFWNTEFTQLSDYRGANANMHSVEALLAAADTLKDDKYRTRAGRIISRFVAWAEENSWRLPEHYTKDWTPDIQFNKEHPDDQFKPYGATPGHGIEWARLIIQWALSTFSPEDEQRQKWIDSAAHLYRRAVDDGWFPDGQPGIVYTTDWEGKPVVHDRMHWVLAEAINTSSVLFDVTGKPEYAADYAQFMQYLDEYVLDHRFGSCYHQMDRNNQVIGTVWPGKPDIYHALQATLIPLYRKDLSIVCAVHEREQ